MPNHTILGNANNAMASGSENVPPTALNRKTQRAVLAAARTRRERVQGGMSKTTHKIQQAKRRADKKEEKRPLQFKVPALPKVSDVEMTDAEPEASTSSSTSSTPNGQRPFMFNVPQYLARPPPREVDHKFLERVAEMDQNLSVPFLRDVLASEGHEMLRSVSTVRPTLNAQALPREITVTITRNTTHLPSHMLAVFHRHTAPPPANAPPRPRKVTLYPVHSLVLAANCASITTPPPANPVPEAVTQNLTDQLTIPVWPLALPHPPSYNQLSSYLYTKDVEFLMKTALPLPPPPKFLEESRVVNSYATTLAQTFTSVALAKNVVNLHGLWANAVSLQVVDETFFDVMDVMWRALMTAMAISTGQPMPNYESASPMRS